MNYLKLRSLVVSVALVISTIVAFADNNYKVISTSKLKVQKLPSTSSTVIGSLVGGQAIEVVSIDKGWAKVKLKNGFGYVSTKYIAPLSAKPSTGTRPKKTAQPTSKGYSSVKAKPRYIVKKKEENPTFLHYTDIYLSARAGVGHSNFIWDNGNVNGSLAYSLDVVAQLYLKEAISFIPENWYSEIAIGYEKKGAAKFDMNYIRTQICPIGFKLPELPYDIFVKGGVSISYPVNDFRKWKSDLQFGAVLGAQLDWEQFSVGCSLSYDFTEVSSACGQNLYNFAVLGTVSYKLKKINAF